MGIAEFFLIVASVTAALIVPALLLGIYLQIRKSNKSETQNTSDVGTP